MKTILLSGSLIISIALNLLIYNRAKQYYLEVNQVRLQPLELNAYPPESNPPKPEQNTQKRVVFFGDSRVQAWPAPTVANYEFINRGIGGQTSVQIIQRLEQHLRPLQPDIVVVQLGINDLKTIPLFPEKKDEIIANCRENIGEIVKRSRDLGALVVVTTIFPFGEITLVRKPFWSDDVLLAVEEINAYISTLADDRIIVFDAFSLLADDRGMMPRKYRLDELHYNQQGYEKINQEFSELLRTLSQ